MTNLRQMSTVLVAFLLTSLVGCASSIMKSYVGQPITAVIEDYGMPSGAYDVEPGKRAFMWTMNTTVYIPGYTSTYGTQIGNQIFMSGYSSPGVASTDSCNYVMYAKQTRTDIQGPAAWTVTSFKKPSIWCE